MCGQTLFFAEAPLETQTTGVGYYQLTKIRKFENSFGYYGKMKCFVSEEGIYYDLPCTFFRKDLLSPGSDYLIKGSLKPNSHGLYGLFPSSFTPLPYTKNLSHLRFKLKEKFRSHLKHHIKDQTCYSFLASLGTGEIESKLLSAQFSKCGLTHTLAISGFHYTWLIFILGAFLNLFFSKRSTCYFLLVIVTLYFLFIGETPSLNRAWLAAIICLVGYLIKEPVNGLNSLGVAVIISLILNPFAIFEIGFQLSYLATFGILALFPSIEFHLRKIFPKRDTFQIGYFLSAFCRNTFALTLGVNLATIPLLLYHFHYFPIISLFFNLFFPIAITLPMIGLILSPIPAIGTPLLFLTELYTTPLLNTVFYGASFLESGIWVDHIPFDLLAAFLLGTLLLGLYLEGLRYKIREALSLNFL